MNAKKLMLGIFVMLTVIFASLTIGEYYQINTLNSQLQSKTTISQTLVPAITIPTVCPAGFTCTSFTSSPSSEVKVDSVRANLTGNFVVFWVTFENTGVFPIHFPNIALNFSIPSNSSVLRQVTCAQCFPGGTDISGEITLNPGKSYTFPAVFPDTKDYRYQLAQPGTVAAYFTFYWAEDATPPCAPAPCTTPRLPFSTITIAAQFLFS
jgi:hypothetical protein